MVVNSHADMNEEKFKGPETMARSSNLLTIEIPAYLLSYRAI